MPFTVESLLEEAQKYCPSISDIEVNAVVEALISFKRLEKYKIFNNKDIIYSFRIEEGIPKRLRKQSFTWALEITRQRG